MAQISIAGDTSGAITIAAPAVAGTNTLTLPAATGTVLTSASNTNFPAGSILQISQAIFTGTQTISASGYFNWTDISSLSVTITPTSSTSKFLLMAQINIGCITVDRIAGLRFVGGNSGNFVGDTASTRTRVAGFNVTPTGNGYGILVPTNINYVDTPATSSAITYKVQAAPNYNSGNVAINYNPGSDADQVYIPRSACSLIVMEIKG